MESNETTTSELSTIKGADEFGEILNAVPTILDSVLSHLPMRDLNRCSQVCKAWFQLSRIVKKKRQSVFWMFWAAKRRKLPPSVCSSCSITEHVRQILDLASSQPKLGIVFVTTSFFEDQGRYAAQDATVSDTPVIDYLVSALPSDCLLLGTCSNGMIGTTTQPGSNQCCVEVENSEGFSCLLLPDIPGMEIHPFVIKHHEDLTGYENKSFLTMEELVKLTKVPPNKSIKCLLLFCTRATTDCESGSRLVVNTLLKKQNHQMALGGGYVDMIVAPRSMLSPQMFLPHTMGLCVTGDKVQAASVVVNRSITKKKSVEKILEQLKCVNLTKNSFCLMFACVGRGFGHYGQHNVEADAFQKVFPNVPLFGLFGNGEIGINYLPKSLQQPDVKRFSFNSTMTKKSRLNDLENPKIFHSYTTVFVLISVEK
ncbi:F-box protein 22 [Chamberlinius hualienensis]